MERQKSEKSRSQNKGKSTKENPPGIFKFSILPWLLDIYVQLQIHAEYTRCINHQSGCIYIQLHLEEADVDVVAVAGIAVGAKSLWWSVLAPFGPCLRSFLAFTAPDLAVPDDVLDLESTIVPHDVFSHLGGGWVGSDFLEHQVQSLADGVITLVGAGSLASHGTDQSWELLHNLVAIGVDVFLATANWDAGELSTLDTALDGARSWAETSVELSTSAGTGLVAADTSTSTIVAGGSACHEGTLVFIEVFSLFGGIELIVSRIDSWFSSANIDVAFSKSGNVIIFQCASKSGSGEEEDWEES